MRVAKLITDVTTHLRTQIANLKLLQALMLYARVTSRACTKLYKGISRENSCFWYYEAMFQLASSTIDATTEFSYLMAAHIKSRFKQLKELSAAFQRYQKAISALRACEASQRSQVDKYQEEIDSLQNINKLSPSERYEAYIEKAQYRYQKCKEQAIDLQNTLRQHEREFDQFCEELATQLYALFVSLAEMDKRFYEVLGDLKTFYSFKYQIVNAQVPESAVNVNVYPAQAIIAENNEQYQHTEEYEPDFRHTAPCCEGAPPTLAESQV